MRFEWDHNKNTRNFSVHGLDFREVEGFAWDDATYVFDVRFDYGEPRVIAIGRFRNRLTVLVFTSIQNRIRIISWRKANKREIKIYGDQN